jgi:hypothetical protein
MANVTIPLGISFANWSDQIKQDLPYLNIPIEHDVNSWRSWASQVLNNSILYDVPAPTALAYPNAEDWKIWAAYFVDTVYNLNTN